MASGIDNLLGTAQPCTNVPADGTQEIVAKLYTRYRDSYRVANFVVGVGQICKFLAVIFALLIIIVGVMVLGNNSNAANNSIINESTSGYYFLFDVVFGVFVGLFGFIIGTLISAVGQIQRATLDNTVNNSHFLSNEDRARIMGL